MKENKTYITELDEIAEKLKELSATVCLGIDGLENQNYNNGGQILGNFLFHVMRCIDDYSSEIEAIITDMQQDKERDIEKG